MKQDQGQGVEVETAGVNFEPEPEQLEPEPEPFEPEPEPFEPEPEPELQLPEPEPESEPELPESEPEPESEAVGKKEQKKEQQKEEKKEVEEDLLLELPTFHVTRHPEHWVCFAQTSRSCCRTTIQFTQAHLGHRHKAQRHNTASKDTEVLNLLLFCLSRRVLCWSPAGRSCPPSHTHPSRRCVKLSSYSATDP